MNKVGLIARVWSAIFALASAAVIGHASVIPVLVSGPAPSGSNYVYSYSADLQQDERLDSNATNGATCPSSSGSLVQCNPAGTFFTIYDVQGFVKATASASGWFPTMMLTGVTPSTILGSSFDDQNIMNVTFFYIGPVVHSGDSIFGIPGFEIASSIDGTIEGSFSSQATSDVGSSSGLTDQSVGGVEVPGTNSGSLGGVVPEPATFYLFAGSGLILLGLRRFRRR